jgi:peroxiredoxin
MATIGVGEAAPALDLVLSDANGSEHRLADALARGPVLLGVYKSSCQASKTMFPFLQRMADVYGPDGLSVFGVAQDSDNITRSFARRLELTFPILVEGPDYPVTLAYDVVATPTVFLIRRDGTVAWTTMGFMRPQIADLGDAIAAELGVPPREVLGDADAAVPMFVPG